ncbi:hypothetical protein EDD80_11327 [Anseongella ginsenosidimutans]|uniref:NADP-dependent 3-hydroxy acid dehydrogenase YdfG n=1 Tax=Anseongella ginsenosidimutans TaxID=496056 RepID=A0A4R3KM42_9SPHI|nr:SDR family NAD(P)-dependent oxidoreductase [Anseongella ginsenosidimutans]QEC52525.1 SDR family NAD(P)-dependent oxidoreductase [Anseongella ginsenosidimutans]TCS85291.1 hypothetical protein EDD80_11327 [Anseongella ginsenosidimutans]
MNAEPSFTLITGASMGIGKALAEECARRQMNLLLVALPDPELDRLASGLRKKYGVRIHVFGLDMLAADAPRRIYEWCVENNFAVDKLVNNIGIGGRSDFETSTLPELDSMLILNIKTATFLSKLFVERLKRHPRSYILNVGSAAGFFHVPHKAVYSATKAYLYSLTRALRSELKPLGVHVTLLAPGGANNKHDPVVHRKVNGWLHRNLHHSPEYIARTALDGMLKGRNLIVPGFLPKVYIRLSKAFPASVVDAVVRVIFRNR